MRTFERDGAAELGWLEWMGALCRLEYFAETWQPDFTNVYARNPESALGEQVKKALQCLQDAPEKHKILVVWGGYNLQKLPAYLTAYVCQKHGQFGSVWGARVPADVVVMVPDQTRIITPLGNGLSSADVVAFLVKNCHNGQIDRAGVERSLAMRKAYYQSARTEQN